MYMVNQDMIINIHSTLFQIIIFVHWPYFILFLLKKMKIQQQQHQEQQHHKMGGRTVSGLEELIMGCSSTDVKEVSS